MRCIKHHAKGVEPEVFDELARIARLYSKAKNIIYNKYGGIRSIKLIFSESTKIRKECMVVLKDYGLPYKFKESAFFEAVANIKSMWSNAINKIKSNTKCNKHLSDKDKQYIYTCLKYKNYLEMIINNVDFQLKGTPDVDQHRLNSYIRRQLTRYSSKPFSKKERCFTVVENIYKLKDSVLYIQGMVKNKRIKLELTDADKFSKEIRIVLNHNNKKVEIHTQKRLKADPSTTKVDDLSPNDVIGVDKNYSNVITTSNGNVYGDGLNKILYAYSTMVVKNEAVRQGFRNKVREYEKKYKESRDDAEKDFFLKKIQNIFENNLSSKMYDARKARKKRRIEDYINQGLNQFFKAEKPTNIAQEYLGFKKKKRNKKTDKLRFIPDKHRHSINNWCKGVINRRLTFKSLERGVGLFEVNAAYTSQVCCECNHLQGRSKTDKFKCTKCGVITPVHKNSAVVIKGRLFDNEIDKWTSRENVRKILQAREAC